MDYKIVFILVSSRPKSLMFLISQDYSHLMEATRLLDTRYENNLPTSSPP